MVKFAVFSLFFIRHVLCLTFEPDSATNIMSGGTVKLVCDVTVAAFIDPVTLTKDTVQKTSCDNGNICTPFTSDSGRYQYTSNSSAVTVQITNLTQASDRGTWTCRVGTSAPVTYVLSFESTENPDNEGSATTVSTFNLSTDVSATTNSQTSSELSTDSLPYSQSSVSLYQSTLEGTTFSGKTETSTSSVTLTSPSGLSEEMIIIISTLSSVGGISLVVIIVIVLLCCKRSAAKSKKNKTKKQGKLHIKNDKNKDLNSNYKHSQKIKQHAHLGRKIQGGADPYQKHPHNDNWNGGRMPTGVEYPRSKNYHQQEYFPRNKHYYRNQNSPYYFPYTKPRNVMYFQRYPGSGYSEDLSGYSRAGPYRMQQFYPKSYSRQDRYTEDELERRTGRRRGDYEGFWDNDTLY